MAASGEVIQCQCGARLRIPANAGGKRVRCPKCEYKILIPADGGLVTQTTSAQQTEAPRRPARPKPAPVPRHSEPAHEEGDSLLDDFMESESAAQTAAGPDLESNQKLCPSCKSAMAKDAKMCVMCGHDLTKQKAAPPAKGKTSKERAAGAAKSGGKFLVGCLLSCVGALIGAAVWFGVAMATDREFGLIAIGVGALAGGGMALGYRKPSALAGWVAVGTTVMGITVAKVLIFAFVLYATFTGDTDNVDLQREYVKFQMLEKRYEDEGVWSDTKRDKLEDEYTEAINTEVDGWSEAQVREKWKELKDAEVDFLTSIDHSRIAGHRASLRVQEIGAEPWGDEYDAFHNEEMVALRSMSKEEVEAEVEKIDRWEEGECWNDPDYIRNHLIYEKANTARSEEFDEIEWTESYDKRYAAAWKKHYDAAVAEVDAMSPEDRLAKAKSIQDEELRQQEEFDQRLAEFGDDISGGEVAAAGIALVVVFFFVMFGLFGTVFTIFAAITAYRVASNGMT